MQIANESASCGEEHNLRIGENCKLRTSVLHPFNIRNFGATLTICERNFALLGHPNPTEYKILKTSYCMALSKIKNAIDSLTNSFFISLITRIEGELNSSLFRSFWIFVFIYSIKIRITSSSCSTRNYPYPLHFLHGIVHVLSFNNA